MKRNEGSNWQSAQGRVESRTWRGKEVSRMKEKAPKDECSHVSRREGWQDLNLDEKEGEGTAKKKTRQLPSNGVRIIWSLSKKSCKHLDKHLYSALKISALTKSWGTWHNKLALWLFSVRLLFPLIDIKKTSGRHTATIYMHGIATMFLIFPGIATFDIYLYTVWGLSKAGAKMTSCIRKKRHDQTA